VISTDRSGDKLKPEEALLSARSAFLDVFTTGWKKEDLSRTTGLALHTWMSPFLGCSSRTDAAKFLDDGYNLGSDSKLEMRMRTTIFHGFWTEISMPRRALWLDAALSQILTCSKMADGTEAQARLLFLTFGPVRSARFSASSCSLLMWDGITQLMNSDAQRIRACYSELAQALSMCHARSQEQFYELIKGLFTGANGKQWSIQSCASLLVLSTAYVRQVYLDFLVQDNPSELPDIVAYLLVQVTVLDEKCPLIYSLIHSAVCHSSNTCEVRSALIDGIWSSLGDVVIKLSPLIPSTLVLLW